MKHREIAARLPFRVTHEPAKNAQKPCENRYARQEALPWLGAGGQTKLRAGHVAIVGMGALGCASADLLARAGVGTLTIIDRDCVEMTNLQRQTLYSEEDARAGAPKVEAAARRIHAINAGVRVLAHAIDLSAGNAEEALGLQRDQTHTQPAADARAAPTVIIDAIDNFTTRYLLNDICVKHAVPFVYGGVLASRGMQATFTPGRGPCLRCIFEECPQPGGETCETAGVIGPAVAIIGAAQAMDAIKVLLGAQHALSNTLLEFDLWTNERRRMSLGAARADCPACGKRTLEFLHAPRSNAPLALCGGAVHIPGREGATLDLATIGAKWRASSLGEVFATPLMCRLSPAANPAVRVTLFRDARAIIHGVRSVQEARTLYDRYVGG